MESLTKRSPMHIGRKVGRMRELLDIKQETLAAELGITQQAISKLEQSEKIDDERLEQIAKKLGVNVEAIKNLNEDTIVSNINNTFHDSAIQNNINPIDAVIQLNEKNTALYERLLQSEREKIVLLEKVVARLELK